MLLAFAGVLVWGEVQSPPSESVLKARYLLNLAEFVEWPSGAFADQSSPLVIGVVGDDSVRREVEKLKVRRVAGRRVEVRDFDWRSLTDRRANPEPLLRTCQILFVGRTENRVLPIVFSKIRNASVLTVGDGPGFTREYFANQMCGVIEFFVSPTGSLDLEINLEAAERAGLKISTQLLRLMKRIRPEDAQPRTTSLK